MIRAPESCACPILEVGPPMAGTCPGQFLLFMGILEAFVNGRCDLADPCRRVHDQEKLDESYDFIVVGGGTAGSVVAGRLSANPQWKVLLIEAGGDEPTQSSVPAWVTAYWGREETDWMYKTEPQERACLHENGKCSWPRGKMLGGCSVINGMMYMRGHAADYDAWAVNGATGWSWFDVLPYFLRSEDNKEIGKGISGQYHSRGGPLPVQRFRHAPEFAHDVVSAAIELGYPPTSDLNGDTITGFTIAQTFNDAGSRYSTARAFLRPASHRDNLHVLLNAVVARVLFHPGSKKVSGVEYTKNGETRTVRVSKEVILSSGTLNSPQILLLSGIGPKETLEKYNIPLVQERLGVGQNLHNHVGINLEFTLTKEPDSKNLDWSSAMDYMLNREGPLSSTGMSQLTGIVNSRLAAAGGRHPDIQFFFGGYYASCSDGVAENPDEVLKKPDKREISISAVALQPRSRGYLTLRSADPQDHPIMQPNYFLENHEVDVLVDAAKIAYKLANTTIMREKYGMKPTEGYGSECPGGGVEPTDDFFKCLARQHTAAENHQVGTCKMGPASDPMAVVDMELKVHGINGLRVIDASIMPTVPSGNTAAPTIMIAERGAEFVTSRYQRSKIQPDPLANRFGVPDEPNKQNEDKLYTFTNYNNNNDWPEEGQRWKPWKEFHGATWEHKNFDHDEDWHEKHNVPLPAAWQKPPVEPKKQSAQRFYGSL